MGVALQLRSATIDDFLARPVGAYVAGSRYVVWCTSPSLCGSSHWGETGLDAWRDLMRLFDVATSPGLQPPIEIFMDCRAMEGIDGEVFAELGPYVTSRLVPWGSRIGRLIVLLPAGALGFALAGVLPALHGTFRVEFFHDEEEALAGFGDEGMRAWARVGEVIASSRGVDPDLLRLRRYLGERLDTAHVGDAAAALGISSRSLQRALHAQKTSFSTELTEARMRAAGRLLRETDLKLEVVARRVGCSSSSHLARLFRRATGETPAVHRARHRPDASGT